MNNFNHKQTKFSQFLDKTDEEIIALVKQGRQEFYNLIIERFREKLFFYIMRFVKNEDETKDVLQNVFIKSLKNIQSFDCERKFSSWIYRISHNEAVNWVTQKSRSFISIDDLEEKGDFILSNNDSDISMENWFNLELKEMMKKAIDDLPENYAEVIKMYYFEEMSYKEIADVLNKPVSSIGTLIRRAKKRLLEIVLRSERF